MKDLSIQLVTPDNVNKYGLFCIKDKKNPGYSAKLNWFKKEFKNGLRIKVLLEKETDQQIGFIEYTKIEKSWRPVQGRNSMFIQCMYISRKDDRSQGFATMLIEDCIKDAWDHKMNGVAVMSSQGPWLAGKDIFLKNGFTPVDSLDRFELLYYKLKDNVAYPKIINWKKSAQKYQGWNIIYANQCPWHEKAVEELYKIALDYNLDLSIHQLKNPAEARNGPSGFGTFGLIHDGKLIEDHYISKTRFKNILTKEMA